MRIHKTLFFTVLILMLMAMLSVACSGDESSADKEKEAKDTAAENSSMTEGTTEDGSIDGTLADAAAAVIESPELVEGDVVRTSDGTIEGASTTDIGEGGVSTVVNEDGTTTTIDSEGNVIESHSPTDTDSSGADIIPSAVSMADATSAQPASQPKKEIKSRGDVNIKNKIAIMKTNLGDVHIFFYDQIAPNHVRNFIYLAEKDFYDNNKFHRIKTDFMAQGGMPGANWEEEIPPLSLEVDPDLKARHRRGAISAARTNDPNSATSQFFLVLNENSSKHLDRQYTVYGQVFKGFETLDKFEQVRTGPNSQMRGEQSLPLQDVHIIDVVIEDSAKYESEIAKYKSENGL